MPAPDAYRLRQAKGLEQRRRGMPGVTRAILVVVVVALGALVFVTATGGIGTLVDSLQSSLRGIVNRIVATPVPSATAIVLADAPVIDTPTEPYTNQPRVDLEISIPPAFVGDQNAHVRVYLALEGQQPAPIAEVPVGQTLRMIVPVDLTVGRNDLDATIVEGGVESPASPVVTYILDTTPPKIVIASPANNATINRATATFSGTTQPRTTLVARDAANATSITAVAASDGTFAFTLALDPGPNPIHVIGTDPAGNVGTLDLTVIRGNGKLTANLTASAYRISVASLPVAMQLNVLVLDPDGNPLAGAAVTFSLTVPGIPPISRDTTTGADGRATFTTTLPTGVTTGSGLATVLVATTTFGQTSAQKPITVTK